MRPLPCGMVALKVQITTSVKSDDLRCLLVLLYREAITVKHAQYVHDSANQERLS